MRSFVPLCIALLLATSLAFESRAADGVLLGVDVLEREAFKAIDGAKVGLITNHTGVNGKGRPTVDLLNDAPGVTLVRLFGPEHGIRGELDQSMIEDGVDGPTGLPIVSLYGPRRQPEPEHFAGIDTLVFDIQDIGCRFYTYISTLKLAMQAAADAGLRFVVLDRPNPIDGVTVEGPMLDPGEESFVGCHTLPLRHGMTIGEIAKLFAAEAAEGGGPLDIDLVVIPCEGWRRADRWDSTGLLWIDPSPNMRRLNQAVVYPGVGLLETTNVSVGRGTDTPFEVFGAPWIDPWQLADALNGREIPGVSFVPRFFTPETSVHKELRCGGVDVIVHDADQIEAVPMGLMIAAELRRLYPDQWETRRYNRLLINSGIHRKLVEGAPAEQLIKMAEQGVPEFLQRRDSVLLYAE